SQPFSERRYSRPELLGISCFSCWNSLASPSSGSKRFRPRCAVNPFDLRGPEFLAFYLLLSASVLLVLLFLRQRDERSDLPPPPMDDPYLIAFLRGGEREALRVVTLSLMDRGLLTLKSSGSSAPFSASTENRLELADPESIAVVRRAIEKLVL